MSITDENKRTGKSGQRNRKAGQRKKSDQQQSPKSDLQQDASEQIDAAIATVVVITTAAAINARILLSVFRHSSPSARVP